MSVNLNETPKRDLVGQITAYFINSQVTILLMVALAIFGLGAVLFTPKEENPQIVVPAADVFLQYPGAPAEVVEKTLTVPVEAKIRELTGIDNIYSVSQNSAAKITVQFFVGEDWEDSLFKLQNHLFNWQDTLPAGASYLVKPVIIDDVPIVTLTIAGRDYSDNQLRRIGERLLEDLRSIPNTGNLTINGGSPRTIMVNLDPDKLASYRLSPAAIAQRLQAENIQLNAGDISAGKNRLFIEGGSLFQSPEDLGNTIIGFSSDADRSPIYLRDASEIKDDFGDRTTYSRLHYRQDWDKSDPYPDPKKRPTGEFSQRPGITIGIAKKKGSNAVTVAKQIFNRVEELKSQLPPGVEIAVSRNDGRTALRAVNDLYASLFQAIAIVVALLIAFLGWREALIVAFVIPLTLAGTLLVGWIAGQTINRITLFALILALGTLVDDAIAVTENIHRRFELKQGMTFAQKAEEAVAGVSELGGPVILSTITVILAFVPMRFVTGMMGPYMAPMPFNLPVAMLVSTTLALTVTPFLGLRLIKIKRKKSQSGEHDLADIRTSRIYKLYCLVLEPLLDSRQRRRFVLFAIAGLLMASFLLPLTQAVKFRMLPKADKDRFLIQVDAPLGTELVQTDKIIREMERVLQQDPEVVQFETYVGIGAPVDFNGLLRGSSDRTGEHFADIRVGLTNKDARQEDSETIVFRLRPKLAAIAQRNNAILKLVEDPPGPPVLSTMLAEIYGADYAKLRQLAKEVRQVFANTNEVVDIDDSVKNQMPQLKLAVDRQKANQAGLSTREIAETLNLAIAGANVSTLQVPGELSPVAIQVRFAETDRQSIDDLTRIQLPTPTGELVPLTELVSFEPTTVEEPIFHKNQQRVSYVMGEMGDRSSVYAVIDQLIYFFRHPLPQGYSIKWDGEWKLTLDVFRDLGLAMIIATMLIYFILVGQFRSFKVPLIILGSIPLATIGILAGFSLNGVYFSATAMIGVIALAGIVVRNAIVLLEFVGDKTKEGSDLKAALLEAGAVRFRPILLTSVTTMMGTLSILSDPVWSGLAWTLLSGMLTSSALTLVVIPLMYYGDKTALKRKKIAIEPTVEMG